eukprot:4451129-Prymnesium_polylepis.1
MFTASSSHPGSHHAHQSELAGLMAHNVRPQERVDAADGVRCFRFPPRIGMTMSIGESGCTGEGSPMSWAVAR